MFPLCLCHISDGFCLVLTTFVCECRFPAVCQLEMLPVTQNVALPICSCSHLFWQTLLTVGEMLRSTLVHCCCLHTLFGRGSKRVILWYLYCSTSGAFVDTSIQQNKAVRERSFPHVIAQHSPSGKRGPTCLFLLKDLSVMLLWSALCQKWVLWESSSQGAVTKANIS